MSIMTLKEAAQSIGVPASTLEYYHKLGVVTAQKVGRILLVEPEVARVQLEGIGYFVRKQLREQRKKSKTQQKQAC